MRKRPSGDPSPLTLLIGRFGSLAVGCLSLVFIIIVGFAVSWVFEASGHILAHLLTPFIPAIKYVLSSIRGGLNAVGDLMWNVAAPIVRVVVRVIRWAAIAAPMIMLAWCVFRLRNAIKLNRTLARLAANEMSTFHSFSASFMYVIVLAAGLWSLFLFWSLFAFPPLCYPALWEFPLWLAGIALLLGAFSALLAFVLPTANRKSDDTDDTAPQDNDEDSEVSRFLQPMFMFSQAPRTITIALALATAAELNQILRYEFSLSDTRGAEIFDRLTEQTETYSTECEVVHRSLGGLREFGSREALAGY